MEAVIAPPSPGASVAGGKEKSIRPVRSAPDVRALRDRLQHDVRWMQIAFNCLRFAQEGRAESEVWIWGGRGVCAVVVSNTVMEGRVAHIEVLQNDPGTPLRGLFPELERWARVHGAVRVSGNTPRRGRWDRLVPGFREVAVTYAKDLR